MKLKIPQPLKKRVIALHRRLLPDDPHIGWTPYLWLSYLGFLTFRFIFGEAEPQAVFLTIASVLAFLPLYFGFYWASGRRKLMIIAGIALLGIALAPFNPGANVYIIYACVFAGVLHPPRLAVKTIAVVLVTATVAYLLLDVHPANILVAVFISVLVGGANIYYCQIYRKNAELRLSQDELKRVSALAERERIARDLHDLLGHTLSLITLKSELAGKLIHRDPGRAAQEIRDVEQVSRSALAQVRQAIAGFRAAGLRGEMAKARMALDAAGALFEYDVDANGLPVAQETVLAMVLREAVTNVVRHADARQCKAHVDRRPGEVVMEITDDGKGGTFEEGSGLTGMRERIAQLDGSLEIDTHAGTRLTVRLPVDDDAEVPVTAIHSQS